MGDRRDRACELCRRLQHLPAVLCDASLANSAHRGGAGAPHSADLEHHRRSDRRFPIGSHPHALRTAAALPAGGSIGLGCRVLPAVQSAAPGQPGARGGAVRRRLSAEQHGPHAVPGALFGHARGIDSRLRGTDPVGRLQGGRGARGDSAHASVRTVAPGACRRADRRFCRDWRDLWLPVSGEWTRCFFRDRQSACDSPDRATRTDDAADRATRRESPLCIRYPILSLRQSRRRRIQRIVGLLRYGSHAPQRVPHRHAVSRRLGTGILCTPLWTMAANRSARR